MGIWFAKQADGFRGYFTVVRSTGQVRTGLVAGDFVVDVLDPTDAVVLNPSVAESSVPGLYYFDVTSAFVVENGVGVYGVLVVVDTFAGPSGAPQVRDAFGISLKISQEDFDTLATKADVLASVSTDHSAAISGTAVEGSVITGTYASTALRDDVFWQIEESAVNGITVEMLFNLPSVDHEAGAVEVFGRYTGSPPTTHYMDLWAWNYEAGAFEQLEEEFMPGGMTSDQKYSFGFSERHIDRSNNNEVKIRLVHNVTTYNVNHDLYLDQVLLSSHKTLTAEEIADAVLDADLTGHSVANSLALMTRKILGLAGGNQEFYNQVFPSTDMTAAKMRTYDTKAAAQADKASGYTLGGHLAEYTIGVTYAAPQKPNNYEMVEE